MSSALEALVVAYREQPWLEDLPGAEVLEEGEWSQEHKCQFRECIIRYQGETSSIRECIIRYQGETFSIRERRSGSYHTDWYYGSSTITPVAAYEETKVVVTYKDLGKGMVVERD